MLGIDEMPKKDIERYSRRGFLEGAGVAVLSGVFLAACQKKTDEGSGGVPPRANYDRREQPSPLPIELTNEERDKIDSLACMAAVSVLERIRSKPNYLQEFSPEACVALHMSNNQYKLEVQQNITGCEHDPNVGTRIWVTVKSKEARDPNQPCSDDRIVLESPNRIDGDGAVSLEEIKSLLQDDKTRIARLLTPDGEAMKLIFDEQTVSNYCPNKVTGPQITSYIEKVYGV